MNSFILVGLGGAIGAAGRYGLGRAVFRLTGPGFPWGTLAANVLGGLAMGLLVGWLAARSSGDEALRLFLGVGLLGGFTTFSAFSLETFNMIERQDYGPAAGYVLASLVLSIFAVFIGLIIARRFMVV